MKYQITAIECGKTYYLRACSFSMGGIFTLDETEAKIYNSHEEASKEFEWVKKFNSKVFCNPKITHYD